MPEHTKENLYNLIRLPKSNLKRHLRRIRSSLRDLMGIYFRRIEFLCWGLYREVIRNAGTVFEWNFVKTKVAEPHHSNHETILLAAVKADLSLLKKNIIQEEYKKTRLRIRCSALESP